MDNKGRTDIERENEGSVSISIEDNAQTTSTQIEIDSNDNGTFKNNLDTIDCGRDDDNIEFENLITSKNIDDTAKAPRHRRDQEAPGDVEEDAEMSEAERAEIDEQIVVEEDVPENGEPRRSNSYAAKKTVAQGMMDIALLTANANQLRYAIESKHSAIVGLIIFSLVLQVSIGLVMIFKWKMYLRGKSKDPFTLRVETMVVSGIFLITAVNIFIASFTTVGDKG